MMKFDLSRINLNLLVALDTLLKEKHVTNAGKRLYITQSAMSSLLKQLRVLFKDDLFVRGQASRLTPTPYALKLEPLITEAMDKLACIFQPPEVFNPADAQGSFTIGLSDYTQFVLLPGLVKIIARQAPGIQLVVKHLSYINNKALFENNDIDIAAGIYAKIPDSLIANPLFTDRAVCVGDKKNPLLKKPVDGKTFAKAKQLVILYYEQKEELLSEQYIKKSGAKRNVLMTVPNTLSALYSLVETNLISMVLERMAKNFVKQLPLRYQPITFLSDIVTTSMVWHPKDKNNPAHRWLRETLMTLGKKC
jgi:DNA-binding transcriptional LysR family regulator